MSDTSNRACSFSFSGEPSILSLYIQVKRQFDMGTRRSEIHCDISAFTDFILVQTVLRDTFIDICINVSLTLKFQFCFYATNGYCFEAQSIEVRPVDTRTTCLAVTVNLFWQNIKHPRVISVFFLQQIRRKKKRNNMFSVRFRFTFPCVVLQIIIFIVFVKVDQGAV